ncbi:MAG: translocation/assembly module TamB domain-containing protein, partial [Gemmatimonadota bacterium]
TVLVRPLVGRAQFALVLTGSLDSLALDANGAVRDLEWRKLRLPAGRVEVRYGGGTAGPVALVVAVDTASWGGWSTNETTVRAVGRLDSLGWTVAGRVGPTDTIVAGGRWRSVGDTLDFAVDSLAAALTAHRWRLAGPAAARSIAGSWSVDSVVLLAVDGSGLLRLTGTLPTNTPGDATLTALGIDLRDVMGLVQTDTIGILGRMAADLTIGGTARAPLLRGTYSLAEGGYRDFRAPYLQGAFNYADHRLESTLVLWRTGRPALTIAADSLPLDLSFASVRDRKLPGPLYIRATADSADLGLLEAFTQNLRRVGGAVTADVTITGAWDDPRLGGTVVVTDAAATMPGIGVRWEGMSARIHLAKDSVMIDDLFARSGAGTLNAKGWALFERGRPPQIDLDVRTSRFRAMDVRNYLTLVATANVKIKGPLSGATLTGYGRADEGALYFADLITKQIVDLNDPATADLIDTALVRQARLGPSFSNQFIESLRIVDFRLSVGEDFWLRSADANIKLSGSATVNKISRNYRLDGTLTAERGQYTLKMGFITRDFDVQRGTVRFLGTPDLNAELDLTAEHMVKTADGGGQIDIQARITGTLLVPKLTLFSPGNPQMVETDIVSYLMFARSSSALQGTNTVEGARQQQMMSTAFSYILPALSSEIERTLISDLGVPVDYIQIRPGGVGTNSIEGSTSGLTTVTAGWQVGRQTYVAVNAGICNTNVTDVSYRNFGASLEQRLHRDWRATLSVEPVVSCSTAPGAATLATSSLYQLGLDLLWDREY